MIIRAVRIPGTVPARKSFPTEVPETEAYMMKPTLGGMTGPIVAEDAFTAAANPFGYPRFSIIGTIVEPTAAALAIAAPETMATSTLAKTTTYERPPGSGPIKAKASRVKRRVIPAAFMISPASRTMP